MVSFESADLNSDGVASIKQPGGKRGVGSSAIRRSNLSLILSHLHEAGPATRSELCEASGLTRSSVAALVGDLEEAKLVVESPTASDGRPGRPSPRVDFTTDRAVLSAHVAVDSVQVGWVTLGGQQLWADEITRPRTRVDVDETLHDIVSLAVDGWHQAGRPTPMAIGVAVAGLAREGRGDVVVAPNLGWKQVPLAKRLVEDERLRKALGSIEHLAVEIRNEGMAGCLAEVRRGRARGYDNVLYLLGEVGVGAGLLVDGKLVKGTAGYSGEVGHMVANPGGRQCACGATGCWETEVGERAILVRAGLDPAGGRAEFDLLLKRAESGDRAAREALATAGRWLAMGLANLALVTNPHLVVLGGIYERAFPHLETEMLRALRERPIPPVRDLRVVPSELSTTAGLVGAAELAFDRITTDPLGYAARAADVVG